MLRIAEIDYTALLGIAQGFRGELVLSFSIRETTALLDFLKRGNKLSVRNFNFNPENKVLRSADDLARTLKHINHRIDLLRVPEFSGYF